MCLFSVSRAKIRKTWAWSKQPCHVFTKEIFRQSLGSDVHSDNLAPRTQLSCTFLQPKAPKLQEFLLFVKKRGAKILGTAFAQYRAKVAQTKSAEARKGGRPSKNLFADEDTHSWQSVIRKEHY